MSRIGFADLANSDLIIDAIYESDRNRATSVASEPLSRLTGTGNQGGFRFAGPLANPRLVVLYTTLSEADWPDSIDEQNGLFVYYGDNRRPGFDLHDRRAGRGGNQILRNVFARAHGKAKDRMGVPPFLIFSKEGTARDVKFRGLAVPGASHLDASTDLIATWKSIEGERFQNYRAVFTILNVASVSRKWLSDIHAGHPLSPNCPSEFKKWIETGRSKALCADPVRRTRTKEQQLGSSEMQRTVGAAIYEYFKESPIAFEHFAAGIARMMDPNIIELDVTRPSRDGGRDGVGRYRIGQPQNCVKVEFALEAKCYAPTSGLGVRVLSRLISRLRHRQFGILVTTSFLGDQAYAELIEDEHPIVVCAGGDIAELLIERVGLRSRTDTLDWLRTHYPLTNLNGEPI